MEPNTGVTFDDVAGVQEAKEDFMEARARGSSALACSVWLSVCCLSASVLLVAMQDLSANTPAKSAANCA